MADERRQIRRGGVKPVPKAPTPPAAGKAQYPIRVEFKDALGTVYNPSPSQGGVAASLRKLTAATPPNADNLQEQYNQQIYNTLLGGSFSPSAIAKLAGTVQMKGPPTPVDGANEIDLAALGMLDQIQSANIASIKQRRALGQLTPDEANAEYTALQMDTYEKLGALRSKQPFLDIPE